MATDATGTPTALGIPKYNTAVDAPSGQGFNAAMDSIDTLITARIAKSLVTTTGDIIYASGASTPARLPIGTSGQGLVVSGGLPTWGSVGGPGSPVTTLPGSPAEAQQVFFVDNIVTPSFVWLLQWSGNVGKWVFMGGTPAYVSVETSETPGSAGAFVDLATVGPSFTVPRAGDYFLTAGFSASDPTNPAQAQWNISGALTGQIIEGVQNSGGTGQTGAVMRTQKITGIAASATAKLQYKGGSTSVAFKQRWATITPFVVA